MNGTGRVGSLRYVSNPVSAFGGSNERPPFSWKYSALEVVPLGGHASNVRHRFVPVSKMKCAGAAT